MSVAWVVNNWNGCFLVGGNGLFHASRGHVRLLSLELEPGTYLSNNFTSELFSRSTPRSFGSAVLHPRDVR